ncbi:YggT family protein [candidate division CSSED10-310 bacterium]|uniref:YggT family protein n=1 Tax=candidate division CSSED10-310 bacterium TaxID=2855610 RepID=A0ABV6Z5X9_UNCC1
MIVALLIYIVFNLYLVFLILRMTIDEREFFFSPLLQPVYRATEPLLRLIQGHSNYFDRKRNLSVVLVITALVLIRGILLQFISVAVLYHSWLSVSIGNFLPHGLKKSIALSYINFFDLLFQAFLVLLISHILVPSVGTNPIIRFTKSILHPILKFTTWIFYFLHRGIPILALVIVFFAHFILNVSFIYLLSFQVEKGPQPFSDSPLYAQVQYEGDFPSPVQKAPTFRYPQLFYNSLNLVLRAAGFYTIIIIIGAIMSWFRPDPFNPLVQWIETVCAPILAPFRKVIPLLGGIDLSPIVVILLLEFGRQGLNDIFRVIFDV